MDVKKVFGKTIFLIFIVAFVALFSVAFGYKNALIGVMIIVAALMLLGRDMTSKAGSSFFWLLIINLSIGIGSFISSSNIWLGLIINFSLIFVLTYVLASDMKSSVEFPFLLGYILVLSMPVTAEELPLKLLALTAGTIFIVGLNLLVHKKTPTKITGHSGIVALLDMVCDSIDRISAGETVDPEIFNKGSRSIRSGIFDRLQKSFYSTPESRSVMNMAVSIEQLGKSVCREKMDGKTLSEIKDVLTAIRSCTAQELSVDETHERIGNSPNIRTMRRLRSYRASASSITSSASYRTGPI